MDLLILFLAAIVGFIILFVALRIWFNQQVDFAYDEDRISLERLLEILMEGGYSMPNTVPSGPNPSSDATGDHSEANVEVVPAPLNENTVGVETPEEKEDLDDNS